MKNDRQRSRADVDRERRIKGFEWTDEGWTRHGRLLDFDEAQHWGLPSFGPS